MDQACPCQMQHALRLQEPDNPVFPSVTAASLPHAAPPSLPAAPSNL